MPSDATAIDLQTATPQTPSKAQRKRRAQLIDSTISTIAEHGLSNLTLTKVASRADLTAAMVNFHFTNKEALLSATLLHLYEEYEAAVAEAEATAEGDPAKALEALVDLHFDPVVSEPRKIAVWYAFWGEVRARADYMAICGNRDAEQERLMTELCRAVIERDGYAHLDADAVAAGLGGLLEETWQSFLLDDSASERHERQRLAKAYLRSVFPETFQAHEASTGIVEARPPETTTDANDWDRRMLPPWVYNSQEFTDLEKDKIFRRTWLLVGHASEAPNVGDYMTLDAVDERALIIRGKDGVLRAFHNVCRHRASRVVAERTGTCSRAIVCPFHGWTYGLDGRLKGIPAAKTFGDLDTKALGLKPLDLEIWHGFVFIRFGGTGPSVGEMMAPAEAELTPYRLEELQPCGTYFQREMPVDWKVIQDVDNEGYHVPVAHPGLQQLVGDSYYDEDLGNGLSRSFSVLRERKSSGWSEGRYQTLLPEAEHLPESHRRAWLYYSLFPSLSFGFYPDLVEFYQSFPIAPDRCLYRGYSYALPDSRREMRAARFLNSRINDNVGGEDWDLALWSASGMQSSGFQGTILSDKEFSVRAMHDELRNAIPVARLEEAPAPGTVAAVNRRMGG